MCARILLPTDALRNSSNRLGQPASAARKYFQWLKFCNNWRRPSPYSAATMSRGESLSHAVGALTGKVDCGSPFPALLALSGSSELDGSLVPDRKRECRMSPIRVA